jgi:hypothetical protein
MELEGVCRVKLNDEQKLALLAAALQGVAARPTWPDACPPDSKGNRKKVNQSFHVATWAKSIARAAIYVAENDSNANGGGEAYS